MKITVLGAGNTGCSLAADYTLKGHTVTLVKTSHALHDDNFSWMEQHGGTLTMDEFGNIREARIHALSRDLSRVSGADVVLLCTRTDYHKKVLRAVSPYLRRGQILLIVPGYLSTAYVRQFCAGSGVITAEAESSFVDGRLSAPGMFHVGFRNVRNPLGVYPSSARPQAQSVLDRLGTPFTYLSSVAEAALQNPNMLVHTVGTLMCIPRIEQGDPAFCMYHEAFTPSVWRILEALDREKMDVLEALGCPRTPYAEACKFRNSLNNTDDAEDVFRGYAAMPSRASGPHSVDTRYVTEDVPQGLVLLESLGSYRGVPTPTASALITIASDALGRDLRDGGRTVEDLGQTILREILDDSRREAPADSRLKLKQEGQRVTKNV